MTEHPTRILSINSGSSSVRFGLYSAAPYVLLIVRGAIKNIGGREGTYEIKDATGRELVRQKADVDDHKTALQIIFDWLKAQGESYMPEVISHRVVHGGSKYNLPEIISPSLISELQKFAPLAVDHMPRELEGIESATKNFPGLPQIACYDTAFHGDIPMLVRTLALTRKLRDKGIIRYGFHGLSYEYIMERLMEEGSAAGARVIIAHLGNGASMAATYDGRCMDTTMGFTPAGGLVMGTRSGDLDPGIAVHLLKEKGFSIDEFNDLVNRKGGLLGISGISPDMETLLNVGAKEPGALEAVEIFCYQAKKFLGAMAAALGGVDKVVFTGGIGANEPEVRRRVCCGLEFMGIAIDLEANKRNADVISSPECPVRVRVMKTDEEIMIARHAAELINRRKESELRESSKTKI